MKKLFLSLVFLSPFLLAAQPVIKNAENFPMGAVMKFDSCDATGVQPGNSGANQTWDFSSLTTFGDTITEWIVNPTTTPKGKTFTGANVAEKFSDGSYTYLKNKSDSFFLVGTYSSSDLLKYTKPLLIGKRPMTYNDSLTSTYTDTIKVSSLVGTGRGTCLVKADGYGTLKLPNGTFNKVLRVKVAQAEYDSLPFLGADSAWIFSYVWFDSLHLSPLLTIDSLYSRLGIMHKSVSFLIKESLPTGIENVSTPVKFTFAPNPASRSIRIFSGQKGEILIYNQTGQALSRYPIEARETDVPVEGLAAGIYFIKFQTEQGVKVSKLMVGR